MSDKNGADKKGPVKNRSNKKGSKHKSSDRQGARRRGRTLAFQFLYEISLVEREMPYMKRAFDLNPAVVDENSEAAKDFAWDRVYGVLTEKEDLDRTIERFSKHWKLSRIAKVELAILRLSLFELLHRPDIPLPVAINEGVELSKIYGDEHSKSFINGVLDAVAKAINSGDLKPGKR